MRKQTRESLKGNEGEWDIKKTKWDKGRVESEGCKWELVLAVCCLVASLAILTELWWIYFLEIVSSHHLHRFLCHHWSLLFSSTSSSVPFLPFLYEQCCIHLRSTSVKRCYPDPDCINSCLCVLSKLIQAVIESLKQRCQTHSRFRAGLD